MQMGESGQFFLVKEKLACQLVKLSSLSKYARVNGQQLKTRKMWQGYKLSRKTCSSSTRATFHCHQGKLVGNLKEH